MTHNIALFSALLTEIGSYADCLQWLLSTWVGGAGVLIEIGRQLGDNENGAVPSDTAPGNKIRNYILKQLYHMFQVLYPRYLGP